MIYLDSNATTQPTRRVIDAVVAALESGWHNPSSGHRLGQAARQKMEVARQSLAKLIGAKPREIIFTSGATESVNMALSGAMRAIDRSVPSAPTGIVTTPLEHEAVREAARLATGEYESGRVRLLPVGDDGVVDAEALAAMLDGSVAVVSVQWANNETGMVQPVKRLAEICKAKGVLFHSDATQWVGKMPTDVSAAGIDLLSLSAHKFHGPKGVGALYVRRGVRLRPLLGGSQEMERRGGTENTSGIAGMGAAAEEAIQWLSNPAEMVRLGAMRDRLEAGILGRVPGARVNAPADGNKLEKRLWNTTNVGFPRLEAEALLMMLSERGVAASGGAACSSGSLEPSPILAAMGVPPEYAHGSVRFSLSRDTTDAEIDEAIEIVASCAARLRESTKSVV